jgi:hypothetical protein
MTDFGAKIVPFENRSGAYSLVREQRKQRNMQFAAQKTKLKTT